MTHPRIEPERSPAPAQAARPLAGSATPFAVRIERPASPSPAPAAVRQLAQMLARLALMPQDEAATRSTKGGGVRHQVQQWNH